MLYDNYNEDDEEKWQVRYDIMYVEELIMHDLNQRQMAFCEGYVAHGDGRRALLEAGYSGKGVDVSLRRLLSDPAINRYIDELRQPMRDAMQQAIVDRANDLHQSVLSSIDKQIILSQIARGEITESMLYRAEWVPGLTKISDRIAAIKLLAQMHGDLEPQGEQSRGITIIWPESLRDKDADR